jgi:hypothetical protein
MLFMTSVNTGPRYKAMLAHQEMFGKFASPRGHSKDVSLWDNWALDNGAFAGFDQNAFFAYIKALLPRKAHCKFVVVPDIPFQWEPTLVKFHDWHDSIRRLGFPVGIAVQDGATVQNVPWDDIDALFIGGSTEWKRQQWRQVDDDLPLFSGRAYTMERPTAIVDLINEAKCRGKWIHIGRSANTADQLWYAYKLGADSVDGTGERFQPDVKFKWIAKTMWEIHEQRQNTSLLPTQGERVAREAQG